jgi:hypothetical protein
MKLKAFLSAELHASRNLNEPPVNSSMFRKCCFENDGQNKLDDLKAKYGKRNWKVFKIEIFKKAPKGDSIEINKNFQNLAHSPTIGDFE